MTTLKPPLEAGFLLLPLPGFSLLALGGFVDKLRFSADEEDHSQQRYCLWRLLNSTLLACLDWRSVSMTAAT